MIEKYFKTQICDSGNFTGIEVHPVVMPQGYKYPAIVFYRVDSQNEKTKDLITGHVSPERWSFNCMAHTLVEIRRMEAYLRVLFDGDVSLANNIQFMYLADVSSDLYVEELELYSVSIDFYVRKINR